MRGGEDIDDEICLAPVDDDDDDSLVQQTIGDVGIDFGGGYIDNNKETPKWTCIYPDDADDPIYTRLQALK